MNAQQEELADMELVDEILAEAYGSEADADAAYDRYRDDWSDSLEANVKELFETFYNAKHGYYTDRKEKLVEHIIEKLEEVAKVKVTAFDSVHVVALDGGRNNDRTRESGTEANR